MTDPNAPPPAAKQPAALSRELGEFLIELSIALHKHAMYPGGHPSLAPATERVVERLSRVLESRATLSLGVARSQLVIEGVATDSKNPVLKDLAGRLHRHHLGAVTFRPGLAPKELHDVLEMLAIEADRTGQPLGMGPREQLAQWSHVRLYPLTFDRLNLIEDDAPPGPDDAETRDDRTRAAQLWLGMARAALAADASSGENPADEAPPTDPGLVARAIQAHPRGTAYDQVIVGYLLQIADEVKAGAGPGDEALRRRVSQLISDLDSETLQRLLEMGGNRLQRRQFVLNASDGLAVDAVIHLVRAACQTDEETISHSMLRMLRKLAEHAQGVSPRRRSLAEQSVRQQVAELVADWTLDDPNPGSYRSALQQIAQSDSATSSDVVHTAEPERVLQMALEVGVSCAPVDHAVQELVDRGALRQVTAALQDAGDEPSATPIWEKLSTADVIRRIVTTEPLDAELLDLLLPRVGLGSAEPMLDALTASESSQTRRALLDRLIQLGAAVGPLAAQRLQDASWYVQRNMLVILRGLPERPPDFDARPLAEHGDARVRREALRLLLDDAASREWGICRALTDSDERSVRLGLIAALDGCPEAAVGRTGSLAARAEPAEHRLLAVRVLGTTRTPAAVDALLALVAPRKQFLWHRRPPRTPEYRAAVTALKGVAHQPRVRAMLKRLGEGG